MEASTPRITNLQDGVLEITAYRLGKLMKKFLSTIASDINL